MASSDPTRDPAPAEQESRAPLLRRARRHVPHWVWYTAAAFGVALLVIVAQLAFYLQNKEPRDVSAIVERELRLNTLQPGERVARTVSVFRRTGTDYLRATRGLLVLTDKRLIYLGVPPRDISGASGAAPMFDQVAFPVDTMIRLKSSFTLLGFSRALKIDAGDQELKLGIASGGWPRAQLMRTAWDARHQRLRGIGVWAGKVREARAELAKMLEAYRKQPVYHVVRPGDAVSSIAAWYEIPEDRIRAQNGIEGNRIKVGQRLLIRSGS